MNPYLKLVMVENYAANDYSPKTYYKENPHIKEAVDFIISKEMLSCGKQENLERLHQELLNKDWFMTLLDYDSYVRTREKAYHDYENRECWAKKCWRISAMPDFSLPIG